MNDYFFHNLDLRDRGSSLKLNLDEVAEKFRLSEKLKDEVILYNYFYNNI